VVTLGKRIKRGHQIVVQPANPGPGMHPPLEDFPAQSAPAKNVGIYGRNVGPPLLKPVHNVIAEIGCIEKE